MNKNKSIVILPKEECTGCKLCGDCCPKGSISFKEDNEGFLYPHVNEDTCLNCGLCVKQCPALNVVKGENSKNSYAVYASLDEAREKGSSGGVFGLLAEMVLASGGRVWGAAFNDELKLVHTKADTIEELNLLLKSKYIQSDLAGVYRQIKTDLKNGVRTLFCGTPCQVNALRNYVGDNWDKLILVDFVCHGVPSQSLFDKAIQWYEKKHGVKVEWFQFRYKSEEVKHPQSYALKHKTERKIHVGLHYQFPYYFGFQKYITLRPSCYRCKWASPERSGDITLGDYWGVEKYIPHLNAKEGVSMVLCNTAVGEKILDDLKINGSVCVHELAIENAMSENGCLRNPSSEKKERKEFFKNLEEKSFEEVVKLHLTPKKKWIFDLYYGMPSFLRQIVRRVMDKRMKYE